MASKHSDAPDKDCQGCTQVAHRVAVECGDKGGPPIRQRQLLLRGEGHPLLIYPYPS